MTSRRSPPTAPDSDSDSDVHPQPSFRQSADKEEQQRSAKPSSGALDDAAAAGGPDANESAWRREVIALRAQLAEAARREAALLQRVEAAEAEASGDAAAAAATASSSCPAPSARARPRGQQQQPQSSGATAAATAAAAASSAAELSALSVSCFPELEPLLTAVPPVPSAHVYTAASVYLYDSFHCRSIKHSTTLAALQTYQLIRQSRWKLIVRWVGWMHLLLGFVEPPSSITVNGHRLGPSHLVAACIEAVCLAVYSLHTLQQYKAYGGGRQGFWRSQWRTTKVLVLVVCWIDVIISGARNVDGPGVHLSQLLRVFFVLEQSGRMRQLCSCILKSLPTILSVMALLLLHVLLFGVMGFLFIRPLERPSALSPPEESKLFFPSLARSIQSMMVLLTSANFPHVMLPAYRQHWFVALFFVTFVVIGLFFLLQLTTAVVFHSFQSNTRATLLRALGHRERALQAAFTLLSEHERMRELQRRQQLPAGTVSSGGGGIGFGVGLESWTCLLGALRADWTPLQAAILFQAATAATAPGASFASGGGDDEYSRPQFGPNVDVSGTSIFSDSDSVTAAAGVKMDYVQFEQIVRFTQKSFQFVERDPGRSASPDAAYLPGGTDGAAAATAAADSNQRLDVSISMAMQPLGSTAGVSAKSDWSSPLLDHEHGAPGPNDSVPLRVAPASRPLQYASASRLSPVASPSSPALTQRLSAALPSIGPSSDADVGTQGQRQHMPLFTAGRPALQRFARALLWYFTARLRTPRAILSCLGRSEGWIREQEAAADPSDTAATSAPAARGPTPLHPPLSPRVRATTFSLSEFVTDSLTLLHALAVVLWMALLDSESEQAVSASRALNILGVVLQVQFTLEVTARWWLCGSRFFAVGVHRFDLAAVLSVWAVQAVIWAPGGNGPAGDALGLLRLFRVLRLYHRLDSFTLLLRVLSQVAPALFALLGVLFLLLYTYAVIGMFSFHGALALGKVSPSLDYHAGDMYAMNYDDLAHAIISMFHQLAVNDWWVMMEALATTVGQKARVFFISFYAVSVLIVLTACMFFVVDAYVQQHRAAAARVAAAKAANRRRASVQAPLSPQQQLLPQAPPMPAPSTLVSSGTGCVEAVPRVSSSSFGRRSGSPSSPSAVPRSSPWAVRPAPTKSFRGAHQAAHALAQEEACASGSGSFRRATFAGALAASASASEVELLSRIRSRASSVGLHVRLRPAAGMFHTLAALLNAEEDETQCADEADEGVGSNILVTGDAALLTGRTAAGLDAADKLEGLDELDEQEGSSDDE